MRTFACPVAGEATIRLRSRRAWETPFLLYPQASLGTLARTGTTLGALGGQELDYVLSPPYHEGLCFCDCSPRPLSRLHT